MASTSSTLPVCIHCGTPRPADETLCPQCGRTWIDVTVSTMPASSPQAHAMESPASRVTPSAPPPSAPPLTGPQFNDDTGEFDFDAWTLPPEESTGKGRWVALGVLVAGVAAVWFLVLTIGDSSPTATVLDAAESTTTQSVVPATAVPETTVTEPTTTTTVAPTTTTLPYPAASSWQGEGDAIPVEDLALKASGIGPLAIGAPLGETAASLVASLGVPDSAAYNADLCESTEWYSLTWADIVFLFDGYEDDASFIGYRYTGTDSGEATPILATISGIKIGDTTKALRSTYTAYSIALEVIEDTPHFRLLEGDELLLWGPVTSVEDDGVITGIFSPDPCVATA